MAFYDTNIKRVMWYLFAGMRGGITRMRILNLLMKRPFNMNQIGKELKLDYKTVQHHIKVLVDNRLITSEDKKYGTIYFPSQIFEQNKNIYEEISQKVNHEV
ncbi:MAG: winged helix-turn-helix transcriptional regulator [Candidatus Aenigmarchaeota archaeon]|nr:winged helix-turn-helix transcriptional regulator [Candidatus Aenigmarchaeota archaeon]